MTLGRPRRKVNDPDLALRIEHNRQRIEDGEQALEERRGLIVEALGAGWPQRTIAARCGVSRGTVSRLAGSLVRSAGSGRL